MNDMNERNVRHTMTLNDLSFNKLRNAGYFGESYSQLILRLIKGIKMKDIDLEGEKDV